MGPGWPPGRLGLLVRNVKIPHDEIVRRALSLTCALSYLTLLNLLIYMVRTNYVVVSN